MLGPFLFECFSRSSWSQMIPTAVAPLSITDAVEKSICLRTAVSATE